MQWPELAEYTDWGLLGLRLVIGVIFLVHGIPKITGARQMAEAMGGKSMVPVIIVQGLVESLGGVALALGILTQWVAIAFALIMIGAILLKNTQWKTGFASQQTTGWEFDLLILAGVALLFLAGPGDIAIQPT